MNNNQIIFDLNGNRQFVNVEGKYVNINGYRDINGHL
jgi:hypothetical protein